MEKKYNIVLGLMIFFFIIIVGVALAWGLGIIGVNKTNKVNTNNVVTSKIAGEQAINNIAKDEAKDEFASNVSVIEWYKGKCLNREHTTEGWIFGYQPVWESGIIMYDNNNSFFITVSEGEFSSNFEIDKNSSEFEIKGVTEDKVADYGIYRYGHEYFLLCFLMKDGTVKYLDVAEAYKKSDFNVKTFSEVKDVVKIASVQIGQEDAGGMSSVIAIQSDGDFYYLTNRWGN